MRRVIVFGGGGHVGTSARRALEPDHEIISVGRRTTPRVDATDPASVEAVFAAVGTVDAIVVCLGDVPFKPLGDLGRDDYLAAFRGKVLPQLDIVRLGLPHLRDGGSITLTTGILAREPVATGAAAALANGALESYVVAAATELPRGIRLNAVSPTVLATAPEYFASFPGFPPVSAELVGAAFKKSVDGVQTGRVYRLD